MVDGKSKRSSQGAEGAKDKFAKRAYGKLFAALSAIERADVMRRVQQSVSDTKHALQQSTTKPANGSRASGGNGGQRGVVIERPRVTISDRSAYNAHLAVAVSFPEKHFGVPSGALRDTCEYFPIACRALASIQVATGNVLYLIFDPSRAATGAAQLSGIHHRTIAFAGDTTLAINNHVDYLVQPFGLVSQASLDNNSTNFCCVGAAGSFWITKTDRTKEYPVVKILSTQNSGKVVPRVGEAWYPDNDLQNNVLLAPFGQTSGYIQAPNIAVNTGGNLLPNVVGRRVNHGHVTCPLLLDTGGVMAYHPAQVGDPTISDFFSRGMPIIEINNDTGVTVTVNAVMVANLCIPASAQARLMMPGAVHQESNERIDMQVVYASCVHGLGDSHQAALMDAASNALNGVSSNAGVKSISASAMVSKAKASGDLPLAANHTTPQTVQHPDALTETAGAAGIAAAAYQLKAPITKVAQAVARNAGRIAATTRVAASRGFWSGVGHWFEGAGSTVLHGAEEVGSSAMRIGGRVLPIIEEVA